MKEIYFKRIGALVRDLIVFLEPCHIELRDASMVQQDCEV